MTTYIFHLSDASNLAVESTVMVREAMDLGRAAQIALNELILAHGSRIRFPVFVDIHPADQFSHVAWMHRGKAQMT